MPARSMRASPEAAALGVRRISAVGTLARAAWAGFLQAAQEIADAGTFTRFAQLPDVDGLFRER
jgi:2-methylisocitrate lyase-like PEP mutase family enzyme